MSAPVHAVTVRRHWGTFRTPWVVRKLRKSRDGRARLPEAYAYAGPTADIDGWVRALVNRTGSFQHPAAHPATRPVTLPIPRRRPVTQWPSRRRRVTWWTRRPYRPDPVEVAELAVNVGLDNVDDVGGMLDADEFALVILAILAVVVLAVIAVPLGLLAIEVVLSLGIVAAGIVLRLLRVKPWTVLVLRNATVVAAIAVTGWRPSRAVLAALRRHLTGDGAAAGAGDQM